MVDILTEKEVLMCRYDLETVVGIIVAVVVVTSEGNFMHFAPATGQSLFIKAFTESPDRRVDWKMNFHFFWF